MEATPITWKVTEEMLSKVGYPIYDEKGKKIPHPLPTGLYIRNTASDGRAIIQLLGGHSADTVVHEWHRDFYGGRLSEDERLLFADYHAQQGGGQSAETFFAKQGTDYFFRRGGHEAAGPIRALFEKARQVLKALLGRINRSKRQQVIPLLIQELYNDAIADAGRTVLTCDSSPV